MLSTPNPTLEETFDQVIRILAASDNIDLLREKTTRITTVMETMITKQGCHTGHTKANPGIEEVTRTSHNRLQIHDKTHPSRISADNPDQIHLMLLRLIDLETEIRVKINPTTRSSQLPKMDLSRK